MATGVSKTKWAGRLVTQSQGPEPSHDSVDVRLSYHGKARECDVLQTQPARVCTLWTPCETPTDRWQNRLYFGDNLGILAALLAHPSVHGQVRLVYIDPPFSTKGVFKSRSQVDAYCDLLAGAPYIEFMRRRLILLRELLADDGSIYVHLDQNMAFHIKLIMDEVFGPNNFRSWITRKKCHNKNYTRRTYGNVSDYLMFYSKTDHYVWNRPCEPWSVDHLPKEYRYVEEGTGRRYMRVPIHAPGVRNGETGKPWRGLLPPPGKHWQFPPSVLEEMDARGEIYWSPNGNPRRKVYLDESKGVPVQDIWLDMLDAHNQNVEITGYPTEKNADLLARVIEASSNAGDLVLDCFSGSGTTLVQASRLQRRWIGIDNSVEAIATTLRRFLTGSQRMGDYVAMRTATTEQNSAQPRLPLPGLCSACAGGQAQKTLRKPIRDFGLYASTPYNGELDAVLAEWSESGTQGPA